MSGSSGNTVSQQDTSMGREEIEAIARDCRERGDSRGLESAQALLQCLDRDQQTQPQSQALPMEVGCGGLPSLAGTTT